MEPLDPRLPATVLIVDDHPFNRELLARRLGRTGFAIRQADGLAEALAYLEAEPIDLVLLDLMMPEIDGLAGLRLLRLRQGPEALPVVVVTASTAPEALAEAFRRGANDFVAKPIEHAALLARIGHQLWLSRTDATSGLPNRRWGLRRLAAALAAARAAEAPCPLVAIALDGLAELNADRGRQAGDDALAAAGGRLAWALEGRGLAARIAGGRFMAHLKGEDAADPRAMLDRIRAALALPFELPGGEARLMPRLTLAAAADHGYDGEAMLRAAEAALMRAPMPQQAA